MTGKTNLKYQPLGESTLLVEWPKQISEDILHQISSLQAAIESLQIPGVVETFSTYQSLAVYFDRECISYDEVRKKIENIHLESHTLKKVRWYIPTCYDLKYAPDLADLANAKGIRAEEVISLHTDTIYRLHFIGFLPGFMYLGGLPEKLHMPRKSNPERSIPSGSVAIGGVQTGIYPTESPGGWHVIGRSPLVFFSAHTDPPCFFQPGDEIQFEAVDPDTFERLEKEIRLGTYTHKKEVIDG